jgi:hypothetical protein
MGGFFNTPPGAFFGGLGKIGLWDEHVKSLFLTIIARVSLGGVYGA